MIEFKNVTYEINNATLIDNLSIKFDKKVNVIVGKSGTGKSIILKQIIKKNANVWINEENIKAYEKSIGYMPQDFLLFPWYSVRKNIEIFLEITRKNKISAFNEIVSLFLIDDLLELNINELSGGQKAKIAFIRAYIMSDEYIILDEPFSKLDYLSHRDMVKWLKEEVYELDRKLILVTHNLDEARFLAEKIFVIGLKAKVIKILDCTVTNEQLINYIENK